MANKTRFIQIARQRMKDLRCSQAELAREIRVTEKNVSVWLDPLATALPTKDKDRVVADMARVLEMDEPLKLEFFAAAGLIYQPGSQAEGGNAAPPSSDAAAPAPPPPASPPGGVSIGQVNAVNVVTGDMTVDMRGAHISLPGAPPDSVPSVSPATFPFAIHPLAGRGRNAFVWNEAEAASRLQISYTLHTLRRCTLLNLDFDYPQPGAWEAPGSRQLLVDGRPLSYGPDLRLAAPLALAPGAYSVFQAKIWRHNPGAVPAPGGPAWVRLEWAEAGRMGSQMHYVSLHLDQDGFLHEEVAPPPITGFREQVRAELERQRQQCELNCLRLESEALSYGQFPPLKLQNEIDFHQRKQRELEAQIDVLMATAP